MLGEIVLQVDEGSGFRQIARRLGVVTTAGHERRAELGARHGRPDPRATEKQVELLLRRVTGGPCELGLDPDEHRSHARSVSRLEGSSLRTPSLRSTLSGPPLRAQGESPTSCGRSV